MQRETTFLVGGGLMIALGVLLAVGLYITGGGSDAADPWLAGAMSIVLGGFFIHVARAERRDRLAFLAAAEKPPLEPPGSGPG